MEHAAIIQITTHVVIMVSQQAITGGIPRISLPLKIVASLTVIARTTIDIPSVPPITREPDLAPSNQARAILMTMVTAATRIDLALTQGTAKAHSPPIHAHNSATGIKTETLNDAKSIASGGNLVNSSVRRALHAALMGIIGNVINGPIATGRNTTHKTHAGRVARQGNPAQPRAGLEHPHIKGRKMSNSKAITRALMPTALQRKLSQNPSRSHVLV